jgi:ribosomal protein L29
MLFEHLKDKTISELYTMIEERKKAQLNMRIRMKTEPDIKPHKMRAYRRDIAKILTRLGQLNREKGKKNAT